MSVVIVDKAGRLGNRLLVFAHVLASAMENGYSVANPAFDDYSRHFPAFRRDVLTRYPAKPSLFGSSGIARRFVYWAFFGLARVVARVPLLRGRLLRLPDGERCDLAARSFVDRARGSALLIQGWLFRDPGAVERQAERLRATFSPSPQVLELSRQVIERMKATNDLVVGVHVRQTDYRVHLDGRFFYETSEFGGVMRATVRLFEGRRVGFLLCGDEKMDLQAFREFHVRSGPGHLIEDLYSFARCDYLIGPPSSYTIWASFYGRVPLFIMSGEAPSPRLDDFLIVPEFKDDAVKALYW